MPRLSRSQERARQHISQLAGRGLLPIPLSKNILSAIQEAVPADGQMLCGVDPATLLFNRVFAQSSSLVHETPWFFQHRYLQAEFLNELTHPNLMRIGLSVMIGHERPETSWGIPPHILNKIPSSAWYRAYHELSAPAGGLLRAFFSVHGQWIAELELVRFESSRPFQPTDGAFLRLLAPTIGRLLSSALAYEQALTCRDETGIDTSGILLLDTNGNLTFRTQSAETWIHRLHEEESFGSHLPTAIWSALARLQTLTTEERVSRSVVYVPTSTGSLRVEASRGNEDNVVAVVLIPERRTPFPDLPLAWPFTKQEKQVFGLLLRGLNTPEIASMLIVSENTVETHVRHIYEKLDVHTRNQLLARFFQEIYGSASNFFP